MFAGIWVLDWVLVLNRFVRFVVSCYPWSRVRMFILLPDFMEVLGLLLADILGLRPFSGGSSIVVVVADMH